MLSHFYLLFYSDNIYLIVKQYIRPLVHLFLVSFE
jgi:hypothetical protein